MEGIRLDEELALKTSSPKGLGGSSPSPSVILRSMYRNLMDAHGAVCLADNMGHAG